jgi:SAM-dependent methyltransferase
MPGEFNLRRAALQWVLRSNLAWILTGISLSTAVRATRGRFLSISRYLEESRAGLSMVESYIDFSAPVLEFGCGVGGNLFALSPRIPLGIGIDINPLYILQGTRLGRRLGIANVSLEHYNGRIIPTLRTKVGTVLSLAVIERIQKPLVRSYLRQLKEVLRPGGHMILYFLTERARDTSFDLLLGAQAYVYWSDEEIATLFGETDFRIDRKIPFEAGTIQKNGRRTTAADVWIVAPRSA